MEKSGMNKKYVVRLSAVERGELEEMVSKGKAAAYRIKHANILLMTDEDGPKMKDEQVAAALSCHTNTVRNVRQRLVEEGLESALDRKKQERPSRKPVLDGAAEARLVAVSCSQAPEGRARWTMRLLADKLVELEIVDAVSASTVCRTLKKTSCGRTCVSVG